MQPQYRPYNQQGPQRAQHASTPRRGGIGTSPGHPHMSAQNSKHAPSRALGPMMAAGSHHAMPLSQAQMAQQQHAHAHASELAKRRSRKPTDKTMPDGVEDCVIDADNVQRYRDLRDLEKRLDATMTRKRLDIVESASRNAKRYKTLRIWISNTVEDQIWQGNGISVDTFDFAPNMEASYRVKIEGRLLDDDDDDVDAVDVDSEADAAAAEDQTAKAKLVQATAQKYRFSHFFKSLTVDFDKNRMRPAAEQSVEWKKPDRAPASSNPPAVADFDELTFKRSGDENMNITINLTRHEEPERFQLTPELADVIDMSEATRQEVMMGIWEYVKAMGLQEDEDKRNFRCDELLKKVTGRDGCTIPQLNEAISPHLKPLPPISLPYTIRVDEEFHKDPQPTIYDVRVAVEDPLRAKLFPFITNPSYAGMLKEVAALDDQVSNVVQAIGNSKAKHVFFTSLAQDPTNFVRHWLSSQKRDLDVITGESSRGGNEDASGDEWRRGGKSSVWATANARESVNVLLSRAPHQR